MVPAVCSGSQPKENSTRSASDQLKACAKPFPLNHSELPVHQALYILGITEEKIETPFYG